MKNEKKNSFILNVVISNVASDFNKSPDFGLIFKDVYCSWWLKLWMNGN